LIFYKIYYIIIIENKKKGVFQMKALVIVDMQNDFVDGSLGSPEAQAIVPTICENAVKLAQESVANGDGPVLVLYTKDTHYENYLETQEGKNLPVPHCIYMTPGWSIVKAISSTIDHNTDGLFAFWSDSEVKMSRILKNTFGSRDLTEILVSLKDQLDEIVFMGVCTDICVVSNVLATKMMLPETLITVDASCCAGVTPAKHEAALETMRSCQINVING
jgi:nicotinamidase-related amidase